MPAHSRAAALSLPLILLGCAARLGSPAPLRPPESSPATSSASASEDPVAPFEVTFVAQAQDASDPVPLPYPEPRQDAWQSPDGELVAHLELVSRGVLTAPSWRLIAQRRDSEERGFVAHGGPGVQPKVTWSTRGHHMLVASSELLFFDADTRRAWGHKTNGFVEAEAIDADGAHAAFATTDGSLAVVARDAKEPVIVGHIDGHARQLALASDHVAAATETGEVGVWNVTRREREVALEAAGPVQGLAWSADGEVLAVRSHGALRLVRWTGKDGH